MFTVEVQDRDVQAAMDGLGRRMEDVSPVLRAIGEDIMSRAKQRFSTSTGPDGRRWAPNSRATIEAFIFKHRGFGKKGINKKGQSLAIAKKPLIGDSHDLARQFVVRADQASVTIGNTMQYAAMQQFGGLKAAFPNLWGDIPARPFLPISSDGDLYPAERNLILEAINDYLAGQ